MTRTEREDLLKVCRLRMKVAKADANAVAARRKAEFEAQLAAIYSWDSDEVWARAHELAKLAAEQARAQIAKRSEELGIPRAFAPSLHLNWYGRGENAIRERRVELTKVAYRKIDQLEKEAKLEIERAGAEIQTRLVASGLESSEARAFLETMPAADQLIPAITVEEVRKQLMPSLTDEEDDDDEE